MAVCEHDPPFRKHMRTWAIAMSEYLGGNRETEAGRSKAIAESRRG